MAWIDTVLRRLRPSAVAGYCPAPVRVASDLWQLERRLRFPPGLVLSGSPDEGALIGNVRPAPAPPGRGRLVTRDRGVEVVQLAWREPSL